jgi:hypothetical protein
MNWASAYPVGLVPPGRDGDACEGQQRHGAGTDFAGLARLQLRRLLPIVLLVLAPTALAQERADAVTLSPEQKAAVEAGVGIGLANPGAAKFGPLAAGKIGDKIQVCGWVDGKAYAGVLSNNFFSLFDIGDAVGKSCRAEGILPDPKTGKLPQ